MRKGTVKGPQLSRLVDMYDPKAVLAAAEEIFSFWYAPGDFSPVKKVFVDFRKLYSGRYPGYRACSTRYHDEMHITDAFLAMARLLDGYNCANRKPMPARLAALGLIAALLHDTGFVKRASDRKGTGAKYTATHVDRSIVFMRAYFRKNGFAAEDARIVADSLKCTDLCVPVEGIRFRNRQEKIICRMLGSADLLGQMASRCYLERLLLLYGEFREAGVPGYGSELELLKKTVGFAGLMDERLDKALGGVRRYLRFHFKRRHRVARDLYREAISRQLGFLRSAVLGAPGNYRDFLRRAGHRAGLRKSFRPS